jgi:gas vesicle protein
MLAAELMMNTPAAANSTNNGRFLLGLVTGGVVGAALAIAFAPRLASELRERVTAAAGDLSDAATKSYRDASTGIVGALEKATARGEAVRDDVADAVARGARSVEQLAVAAKSGRT